MSSPPSIVPFTLAIPDADLSDLRKRLSQTRWPERETVSDWSQGVPLHVIQDLCSYWETNYDWRRCESWLNAHGQHKASIEGFDIHFLHIKSSAPNALPLLLLHGWPGSVIEFNKVIGPLTDPVAHGGKLEDAFHLVIPSMPGYGFSSKPHTTGTGHRRIGSIYTVLMERLGYDRWVAQGGDWGADVCAKMASDDPPSSLAAIHMSSMFFDAHKEIASSINPTAEEKRAVELQRIWETLETGYFLEQATRPQTIGYSLADSPVGQAAWIYEKLYKWAQHNGDLESVLSKDEMLDDIMLYWLTNTGASSARLYWEEKDNTALPIKIPVGVTSFPGELEQGTKEWCERYYSNLVYWNKAARGGHFAAWEVPDVFAEELRDCFRHIR